MTCAQLHAHGRFAEQRAEWNREYRRIYARRLRGTVSEQTWKQWLTDATWVRKHMSGFVFRFEDWTALKQTGSTVLAELERAELERIIVNEYGATELQRIVDEHQAEAEARKLLEAVVKHLQRPG
jgi:hypothetical protein